MGKTNLIRNLGNIEDKSSHKYYLCGGLLSCLTPAEACDSLNLDFSQDRITRELILNKILNDIQVKCLPVHLEFIENILKRITALSTYHSKQAASVFLKTLFPYLPNKYQTDILNYFLDSPFYYDRNRAFLILSSYWRPAYANKLLNSYEKHKDFNALQVIIRCLPTSILRKYSPQILEKFSDEEDTTYNFEFLKLRTTFYARLHKYLTRELDDMKHTDPISFVYIAKEAGLRIEPDLAYKIYKEFPHKKRLLLAFGQMGLWDALVRIANDEEIK